MCVCVMCLVCVRMVFLLQKMLSFALEVDRSPALNSSKLSGELFHTLISTVCLRQHRSGFEDGGDVEMNGCVKRTMLAV